LDGSQSSDPDGDALTYAWVVDGQPLAGGVQTKAVLEVGTHQITLVVTDPQQASGTATVQVEVIPAGTAAEILVGVVDDSPIERGNKRPFVATLKNATAAFDDGRTGAALNMLHAFQNKARAQVGKANPDVAAHWIALAQMIIDALSE